MKKILALMLGLLFIAVNLYAQDGDLIVEGDITLGDGTDTSRYIIFDRAVTDHMFGYDNTISFSSSPAFYLSDSIYVNKTTNFSGYYLGPNGQYGGFVKKNGKNAPLISADSVFLGTDSNGVALAWDTIWDGLWGYCEGVSFDTGTIDCADYTSTVGTYDNFWVWQHGGNGIHPESKDFKFVFDGESNDGVMGYMEDEDVFYFNEKLGIGTTNPTSKVDSNGSVGYDQLRLRTPYTPSGTSDTNGNIGDIAWDDNYVYVKTSGGWKRTQLGTW